MKKRVFLILIICIFLSQNYGIYFSVKASDLIEQNDIYYITENNINKNQIKIKMNGIEVKGNIKKIDIKNFQDYNKDSIIWVDGNIIKKPGVKNKIIKMYNMGQTIVIRRDNISKKEALEYLDIDDDYCDEQIDKNLKRVAVLVRKIDKNSYDIIGLNVYDDNDDNIKEGMLYMSKSDFNLRIRKRIIDKETEHVYNKNTSLRRNLVQAANWKSVKVGSNVDVWKTVKIQWSIDLQKDADSPTNGQYRSYHKAIIEAETTDSMYKIKEMYIYQDGGGKTKVYNYDPKPSTQNLGQVTFSLPWGVSYTYDLGSSVKIEKNAGGIGSSYVELRFINSIHTRVLNGIVATEQFQTGTSYYSSGIRYIVKIKKDEGFPKVDDYATANASHYVGGY